MSNLSADESELPMFLTVKDMATCLQVSESWLYRYRRKYKRPRAVLFGHKLRVRRDVFLKWANNPDLKKEKI